jgi:LPS sulfotransferase NodH
MANTYLTGTNASVSASASAAAAALAAGPALYQAEHDLLPLKSPTFRYALLSSQRTGSNYLCRRLCNVSGRLGLPGEYLHPQAIRMMASRLMPEEVAGSKVPLGKFLTALMRARTTQDGAFGIKVQPLQLMALVGRQPKAVQDFFQGFDRIVLMTRHDKLGQAVLGAIAAQTGKWFGDGKEPSLDSAQRAALFPFVASNLARYIEEERLILEVGKAVHKPVLRIAYESIEQNGPAAFAELTDFLLPDQNISLNEIDELPVPKKSSGGIATLLREEFLRFIGEAVPAFSPGGLLIH